MMHSIRSQALALVLGSALSAVASAQPYGHRDANGVNWLSGGVSLEERDAMSDAASRYDLQVVLAMSDTGQYRAEVPVTVEDMNGNPVLSVVTDGPWLFANVPSGRYRVRTGDGQEQTIEVGGSGRTVVYFHALNE